MSHRSSQHQSHPGGRVLLKNLLLAPATTRNYTTHFQSFLSFARLSSRKFFRKSVSRIDRMLSDYVQHLFDSDLPYNHASYAIYGCQWMRPDLKGHLLNTDQLLRAWDKDRFKESHPPMTWEVAVVLSVTMARSGFHAHAIALLLAFDCYLRVSELVNLERRDVILPNDSRAGSIAPGMALRLAHTKTGPNQWVELKRPQVCKLVNAWLTHPSAVGSSQRARVFPFSAHQFRDLLKLACHVNGVSGNGYTPHSLRHGGATCDYIGGANLNDVLFRGRWEATKSAKVYLQTGRARLALCTVPLKIHQLGLLFNANLVPLLTHLQHIIALRRDRKRKRVSFAERS